MVRRGIQPRGWVAWLKSGDMGARLGARGDAMGWSVGHLEIIVCGFGDGFDSDVRVAVPKW